MTYPLLILDLDGTLVDSFEDIASGIRAACTGCGVVASDEVLALIRRGVPLEDFYAAALGQPPAGEGWARFVETYRATYKTACVMSARPYPGVAETLARIRELPARPFIAVATTKRGDTANLVLESTGLRPLLDAVVGSDGRPPKPDPAVLIAAAGLAGIDVRRALMVGDTDRDVLAARRAGCAIAAVTYGGFGRDELAALGPDVLLSSFSELLQMLG